MAWHAQAKEGVHGMRLGAGNVLEVKPIDEVILVAMGPTCTNYLSRQFGQLKFDATPVWTINSGCFAFRADLCFDMHTADTLAGKEHYEYVPNALDPSGEMKRLWDSGANAGITREYKKSGVPIVTPDGHDDTLEYPLAEVVEAFQSDYFDCGAAYMIAFAMLCQAKTIHICGFDFAFGTNTNPIEPGRACVEYWLGRAHERGHRFILPSDTTLMSYHDRQRKGFYGYGFTQPRFELIDGKMKLVGFHDGRRAEAQG